MNMNRFTTVGCGKQINFNGKSNILNPTATSFFMYF